MIDRVAIDCSFLTSCKLPMLISPHCPDSGADPGFANGGARSSAKGARIEAPKAPSGRAPQARVSRHGPRGEGGHGPPRPPLDPPLPRFKKFITQVDLSQFLKCNMR